MTLEPKAGLVIRYDYLWRSEKEAGREHGRKDRPCAIVLVAAERQDGARDVVLCAITHAPPEPGESAVTIPLAVARNLGLDDEPCWIKTSEVNLIKWEKGRIPAGIMPARKGVWSFGMIPHSLGIVVFEQVREKARAGILRTIRRDEP